MHPCTWCVKHGRESSRDESRLKSVVRVGRDLRRTYSRCFFLKWIEAFRCSGLSAQDWHSFRLAVFIRKWRYAKPCENTITVFFNRFLDIRIFLFDFQDDWSNLLKNSPNKILMLRSLFVYWLTFRNLRHSANFRAPFEFAINEHKG